MASSATQRCGAAKTYCAVPSRHSTSSTLVHASQNDDGEPPPRFTTRCRALSGLGLSVGDVHSGLDERCSADAASGVGERDERASGDGAKHVVIDADADAGAGA